MSHSKKDESEPGFTRRDLVRGALVGAVAAGVGGKIAPAAPPAALGPDPVPIELTINGQTHRLSVEPRVLLASALRDRLGLTGTKVVCDRGACGACTVLIDGQAACSCLLLAAEVQGKSITTVEGLAANRELSAIQKAFVEADALQCGFCTSGMVMSCKALLDSNPRPSREQIREGLAGNLCRCGTYPHVFEAVERAAGLKTATGATREGGELFVHRLTPSAAGLVHDDRIDAALIDLSELEEA
ncbi:MAG TPA: (2Fe-2S)-binding protein [Thermoanaerobaculia bacterium]|nr:(2Fe-2S)-binding protein [Thermoanaerobaculia bacterium]